MAQHSWTVQQVLDERSPAVKNYYWIDQSASVLEAIAKMVELDSGSLCVVDESSPDVLVGIITERDYLRKVALLNRNSGNTRVAEIMTTRESIIHVSPQHTVQECMNLMLKQRFRHLPVLNTEVDWEKKGSPQREVLVASISQRDLIDEFARYHEAQVRYLEDFIPFPIW